MMIFRRKIGDYSLFVDGKQRYLLTEEEAKSLGLQLEQNLVEEEEARPKQPETKRPDSSAEDNRAQKEQERKMAPRKRGRPRKERGI